MVGDKPPSGVRQANAISVVSAAPIVGFDSGNQRLKPAVRAGSPGLVGDKPT